METLSDELRQQYEQRLARLEQEKQALEQRLAERSAELEHINGELAAFNQAFSHDLRAPVRAIKGFTSALEEDCPEIGEQGRDYLRRIAAAAREMHAMVEALIALSQLEHCKIERETCDLSSITRQVVGQFRDKDPERNISVQVEPGILIDADPRLIRQVMFKLIGNAWQYTAASAQPAIAVRSTRSDGTVRIEVEDNGAGFDEAEAARLFEPFYRAVKAEGTPGTGVGLAMVERIVERHGGTVDAVGRPGESACVAFTLPDRGSS